MIKWFVNKYPNRKWRLSYKTRTKQSSSFFQIEDFLNYYIITRLTMEKLWNVLLAVVALQLVHYKI